jgi:hypothetical protein
MANQENAQPKPAFNLSIPTRENKQASQLRDGLRIMAWQQFKLDWQNHPEYDEELKGKELYNQKFAPLWDKEPYHQMTFNELMQFIKSINYSVSEVLNNRNSYYRNGRGNRDRNRDQFLEESDNSADYGF